MMQMRLFLAMVLTHGTEEKDLKKERRAGVNSFSEYLDVRER